MLQLRVLVHAHAMASTQLGPIMSPVQSPCFSLSQFRTPTETYGACVVQYLQATPSRSPPNMACFLTLIGRFDNNPGSDDDWKPQIKAKCSAVQECNETRKTISLLFIILAPSAKYHPSVWEYGRICATLLVYSNTFKPLLTPREPFWCPL